MSLSCRGALALLGVLGATGLIQAHAGDHGSDGVPLLPAYRQECAACHLAYPPGLLPAASWQRLMSGLGRHFGTDASLDAATAQAIGSWLAANAGTSRRARGEPPQDRITRSAWFVREHDELAPTIWQRPAVKTPANCTACHTQADQGDFDEHAVRIPR
jgi:Dihaem cytochrome c